MATADELIKKMEEEQALQDAAKADANKTVDETMKRVEEKEVDQAVKFINDAVKSYDKLRGNLSARSEARVATIAKLEDIKKKLKDRMEDKKIADTITNGVSIVGGIAAFFPGPGWAIALAAGGASLLAQTSSDIVNSIMDADEIASAESVLKEEEVLDTELGRFMEKLERECAILDQLQIKHEEVQALVITAAKHDNKVTAEYRSLVTSVMANLPGVGELAGDGKGSKAFMDPATSVVKTFNSVVPLVGEYALKAFASIALKMGAPKLAASATTGAVGLSTKAAQEGGKASKVFGGLTVVLSIYQIVALWTSTENEAVKIMDDNLAAVRNEKPQIDKAAAELKEMFSKDDVVGRPASA